MGHGLLDSVLGSYSISGTDFSTHSPFKNTASDFQQKLTHPTDTTNMVEGFK
jgi:hypothetical protein